MTTCFDIDTLVSLEAALRWNAGEALPHLTTCSACRERLELLETMRGALAEEAQPVSGFTERVLQSSASVKTPAGSLRLRYQAATFVNAILAGVTALFGIRLMATAAPVEFGPAVVALSVLAAGGAFVWNQLAGRGSSVN